MNKFLETIESSLAVVAIIGLASVSVFTVTKLNPKVSSDNGKVAGELDELVSLSSNSPLIVKNKIENSNSYKINQDEVTGNSTFKIDFENWQDKSEFDFLEITNANATNASITFKTLVPINVENALDIRVRDEIDDVILYSPSYKNVNRNLTIAANSTRKLTLSVSDIENINFPFSIQIEVSSN